MMNVKVAKLSLYPKNKPEGYAVGFNIATLNKRMFYVDTFIPFESINEEGDTYILTLAWEALKKDILERVETLEDEESIIGKSWKPPNLESDMQSILDKRAERVLKEPVESIGEEEEELIEDDGRED